MTTKPRSPHSAASAGAQAATPLRADRQDRLADALRVVSGYTPEMHLEDYLDAAANDDGDLGHGLRAVACR